MVCSLLAWGCVWVLFSGEHLPSAGEGLNSGWCVGLGLCGGTFFRGTFAVGWGRFRRAVECWFRVIGRYFFLGYVCRGLGGVRKVGGVLA